VSGHGEVGANTPAVIPALLPPGFEPYGSGRGELDRIAQQVQQHLTKAVGIPDERVRHVRSDAPGQLQAFLFSRPAKHLHGAFDAVANREGNRTELHPSGLDFRIIENVVE
jgi:hypothetical protein